MGGYGVRATARAFDDQHLKASASEQQGSRGAGDSAADDDRIPGPSSHLAEVKVC
jgi:hypothetical protein